MMLSPLGLQVRSSTGVQCNSKTCRLSYSKAKWMQGTDRATGARHGEKKIEQVLIPSHVLFYLPRRIAVSNFA